MSFGTYARKVRDPSLAYGRRINALAGCVERYRPIGYHATFGYLEHVAGGFRRAEAALLRAIGALSASRDLWLVEPRAYALRRKEAKRLGRRNRPASGLNPSTPRCWYGDARNAAMFALRFLLRRVDTGRPGRASTADTAVLRLASACVDNGGHLAGSNREQLSMIRPHFERLRQVSGWPHTDWANWHKAHDPLWLLHLIEYASEPHRR